MAAAFALVLHTHLPYVIRHGRWPHGSDWLCEAAAESYLPLLRLLERRVARGGPPSPAPFRPRSEGDVASRVRVAPGRNVDVAFRSRAPPRVPAWPRELARSGGPELLLRGPAPDECAGRKRGQPFRSESARPA